MTFAFKLNLQWRGIIRKGELTMAWYDDRAKQFEQNEDPKRRGKELAAQVGHWTTLRTQVEKHAQGINLNPTWAQQLGSLPLFVEDAENLPGYRIRKLGDPKIDVGFRHEGDHVIIDRKFYGKPLPGYSQHPERLNFFEQEGQLFLQRADDGKLFDLPEQMAQYLLEPIVQVLERTG
jgi:hypothetical protein